MSTDWVTKFTFDELEGAWTAYLSIPKLTAFGRSMAYEEANRLREEVGADVPVLDDFLHYEQGEAKVMLFDPAGDGPFPEQIKALEFLMGQESRMAGKAGRLALSSYRKAFAEGKTERDIGAVDDLTDQLWLMSIEVAEESLAGQAIAALQFDPEWEPDLGLAIVIHPLGSYWTSAAWRQEIDYSQFVEEE